MGRACLPFYNIYTLVQVFSGFQNFWFVQNIIFTTNLWLGRVAKAAAAAALIYMTVAILIKYILLIYMRYIEFFEIFCRAADFIMDGELGDINFS